MARHYRRGTVTADVGWEHEDEPFRVRISIGEDQEEIRWGDNACPFVPGDIEVLSVFEDWPGGKERPDLISAAEEDLESLAEEAREVVADADAGADDDAYDRWRDDQMDRRDER